MSFWEDTALKLLEMSLNGDSLDAKGLKDLFAQKPELLAELDIMEGEEQVTDIDRALYGGRPNVLEIRELKPHQVHHCRACNRTFKRADNLRRHLRSALHERRTRALALEEQIKAEEKLERETTKVV